MKRGDKESANLLFVTLFCGRKGREGREEREGQETESQRRRRKKKKKIENRKKSENQQLPGTDRRIRTMNKNRTKEGERG